MSQQTIDQQPEEKAPLLVQAIEAHSLKAVIQHYLINLLVVALLAGIAAACAGFPTAFWLTPFIAAGLMGIQYLAYFAVTRNWAWSPNFTLVEAMTVVAIIATLTGLMLPAVQQVREARNRALIANEFKQIWIALTDYREQHGNFPPAAHSDRAGKPLLSWRVLILPHLGEKTLYDKFKLEEPWNSPNNSALINSMPAVYSSPAVILEPGQTVFLAPIGKDTAWPAGRGLRLKEVSSPHETIQLIEANRDRAVAWSKPEDLAFDPAEPRAGLFEQPRGSIALFVDGTVRLVSPEISDDDIRSLFTRSGKRRPGAACRKPIEHFPDRHDWAFIRGQLLLAPPAGELLSPTIHVARMAPSRLKRPGA